MVFYKWFMKMMLISIIPETNFLSVKWLFIWFITARRLDLYQILAPNAYSYKEEFIPVIKKAVQSQVHEVF